jgi:uncharacterized DUF497 family protein
MTSDDDFEWSFAKARSNYNKHGVTFDAAKKAFADPFMVGLLDDSEDCGEERFLFIGMARAISSASSTRQDRVAFA